MKRQLYWLFSAAFFLAVHTAAAGEQIAVAIAGQAKTVTADAA